jgi:hypothetical protein
MREAMMHFVPDQIDAAVPVALPPLGDAVSEKQTTLEYDNAIQRWADAAGELSVAKRVENDLRWATAKLVFPKPIIGTNRVSLGGGFSLKLIFKYNYLIDKARLPDVLAEIAVLGPEAQKDAGRCIRWRPEIVAAEYDALPPGPVKELLSSIVTTDVATPQLELETPNSKKK